MPLHVAINILNTQGTSFGIRLSNDLMEHYSEYVYQVILYTDWAVHWDIIKGVKLDVLETDELRYPVESRT